MEEKTYTIDEIKDLLKTNELLNDILNKYEVLLSKYKDAEEEIMSLKEQISILNSSFDKNVKDMDKLRSMLIPDGASKTLIGSIEHLLDEQTKRIEKIVVDSMAKIETKTDTSKEQESIEQAQLKPKKKEEKPKNIPPIK